MRFYRDYGDQEVTVQSYQWGQSMAAGKTHTVTCRVDMFGQLWDSNFKSRLNCSHDLLVAIRGDESDSETFRSKSTGTTTKNCHQA